MVNEIKEYVEKLKPKANPNSVVKGDKYRITVLTDRLLRLEYSENNNFIDEPTQIVFNRQFEEVDFAVEEDENLLKIRTNQLSLYYNKKQFSPEGLWITLTHGYGVYGSTWNYGDILNDLKGTTRTLDDADGEVPLETGLMSREGYSVLDDSTSAIITEDGWIQARNEGNGIDIYFFGYGHDYLGCLKDFYALCGKTPLLPRYMLGNYWSRFYPYTQNEYIELMDRFKAHDIPLAVSVIDMDWHKVQVPERFGSGWTGYSWNTGLIPNPQKFLDDLKERGLRVTLNLHPADGVRAFEDAYADMARELNVDYENEEKILFDCTDKKFMKAYFDYLHHPIEDMGVDFWWIDWQQGTVTRTPGIDALWMLNYLHFTDMKRGGKRPVTFSRYAGIGSHKFPIGFSGDSVSSWKSLDFQPYFTANASNVGYAWWSHDIGGHKDGERDDELITRWIQYGVFSPIMRLHATANPFYGKEPWNYGRENEEVITKFMQLRHKLIPYIYSANYELNLNDRPLVLPLYYVWDVREAYEIKNEYLFGEKMIVNPITKRANSKTHIASTRTWLPEGKFFDFFTGYVYEGNRFINNYRTLDNIPVFVKAGGIIPIAENAMDAHLTNPEELTIKVFHGADGEYTMYEDDCLEMEKTSSVTKSIFTYKAGAVCSFAFREENLGKESVIPSNRKYVIKIQGISRPESVSNGDYWYDEKNALLTVAVKPENVKEFTVSIVLKEGAEEIVQPDIMGYMFETLNKMQISYNLKAKAFDVLRTNESVTNKLSQVYSAKEMFDVDDEDFMSMYGFILELLTL